MSIPRTFFGGGTEFCSCCPGWSTMVQSQLTATSASRVQVILCASASQVAGITGTCHHARLPFIFLVETGFCRVGQAGLELLTSGDLPVSASEKCWDYRCESPRLASILYHPLTASILVVFMIIINVMHISD